MYLIREMNSSGLKGQCPAQFGDFPLKHFWFNSIVNCQVYSVCLIRGTSPVWKEKKQKTSNLAFWKPYIPSATFLCPVLCTKTLKPCLKHFKSLSLQCRCLFLQESAFIIKQPLLYLWFCKTDLKWIFAIFFKSTCQGLLKISSRP